jgi:predicted DNA-binding transcriptional regulator YafY
VSRAERLFRIVGILQVRKMSTAQELSKDLGVSLRTIYRDIRALKETGLRIRGEAGVGYRLIKATDYHRVNLTERELKALALGVHLLHASDDQTVGDAGHSALHKLQHQITA